MRSALELARAVLDRRVQGSAEPVSLFHSLGGETVKQRGEAVSILRTVCVSRETGCETESETQRQVLTPCVLSWQEGLDRLVETKPPVRVSAHTWEGKIAHARRFCDRLGLQAEALGWNSSDLFALHPDAPLSRYDAMGAAFLGIDGEPVAISADAVAIITKSGARQTARRIHIPFPPAWETFS